MVRFWRLKSFGERIEIALLVVVKTLDFKIENSSHYHRLE